MKTNNLTLAAAVALALIIAVNVAALIVWPFDPNHAPAHTVSRIIFTILRWMVMLWVAVGYAELWRAAKCK